MVITAGFKKITIFKVCEEQHNIGNLFMHESLWHSLLGNIFLKLDLTQTLQLLQHNPIGIKRPILKSFQLLIS